MSPAIRLNRYFSCLDDACPVRANGQVTKVIGIVIEARGPISRLGTVCDIFTKENKKKIIAEVLGFRDNQVLMMPLEEIQGIGPGSRVVARKEKATLAVGPGLLGRVIDGLGNPIDGKGPVSVETEYPIYANAINPLLRRRINQPLDLGIRAIDGLLTVGCGQRMGVFSGSGIGKSVLLGMIARKTKADVNVIALIGERGREVNEFIQKELGPEGLQRSVIVVATSDRLPLIRMRGAFIATAIAEYFRDQGNHVNFMMDSVTRFAMAQREIGLALDVLTSISRVMDDIISPKHREYVNKLKNTLATYRKAEDLINIGAYVKGSNPKIDFAIDMIEKINAYLKQGIEENVSFEESIQQLEDLFR
jgi:flagellum-specific ATP synthase